MRIDKKLNIVIPFPRSGEGTLYIHATPIMRETFETYFLPISVAFTRLWQEGLSVISGPRVALMMLKKASEERRIWDGPDGVQAGLVEEMKRLTNVVVRGPAGWSTVPMYSAIEQKLITDEERDFAENAVTFFTLVSAMQNQRQVAAVLEGMNDLWGTQSVLYNSTEFAASLTTSTGEENTGVKAAPAAVSSVPS